jgi:integrase
MDPQARSKKPARKLRLSELSIHQAKPKTAAYAMWDTKQHGLALRVQPSGSRSWYCVYSYHGRPRWLRLGDAGAIGLSDARTLAAEAMLAVARGKDPAAEKRAERGAGTFPDLAVRYLEQHAKRHNKSWRQGDKLIRRHALPRWGKLQAGTITRADVKAMMASIEAPIVANQTLAAVSAIFSWALKEEILPANPCKLVERNATKSRERVLSDAEVPVMWSAFEDIVGSALKLILLLGQRPGEVAPTRHEHIKNGWWEMPGDPVPSVGWPGTKNGAAHRVWIPKPAVSLIAEVAEEGARAGFVLAGPRGAPVRGLDHAMRTICRKLQIERATPHDLRRTHGTTIAALGFGRDAMNRVQNHKEGGIGSIYDRHSYAEENKRIMEAVAQRLVWLAEGGTAESNIVPIETRNSA